jgi:hypothetical protein
MTWTTPRTWADGETITTVILNQHIRDELLALLSTPACKMWGNVATNITNAGTSQLVTLDTNILDTDTMGDTVNNRINIKTAGKFFVYGSCHIAGDTTGWRKVSVFHHRGATATEIARYWGPPGLAGADASGQCSTVYDCQVNDYLDLQVAHTGSGTLAARGGAAYQYFSPQLLAIRMGT